MKRRSSYFFVWLLCLGLGVAGCKQQPTPEASPEAFPEAPLEVDSSEPLRPVALPVLDDLEESVRVQLREQHARLQALADQPDAPPEEAGEAHGTMGQLLLAYDLYEAAEPALRNAAALLTDDARWPFYLGYLERLRSRVESAVDWYERALALQPDDVPTHIHLAEIYRDLGREEEAKTLLQNAVRLDPQCAVAYYMLGQLTGPDETSEAITYYETAMQLQPGATVVRYPLGLAYRDQGDLERSREHLARRGDVKFGLRDPLLGELEQLKKGSAATLFRGTDLASRGQIQEALALFEQVVADDPDNVEGYMHLGTTQARLRLEDEAIQTLEHALRLDPTHAKAHFFLGVLYGGKQKAGKALEHFRASVEADPNDSNARFALSKALWKNGACREALPHFKAFLDTSPEHAETRLNAAICHARLGAYAEARALLEAGYAAAPQHPGFQDALVRILAASADDAVRDGPRALDMALRLAADLPRAEVLESLAMAYAETGRYEKAVEQQKIIIRSVVQQGKDGWLKALTKNLRRYENGQPCRTPWSDVVFER